METRRSGTDRILHRRDDHRHPRRPSVDVVEQEHAPRRVLILGGTTEAAELTRRVVALVSRPELTVSFAGRTTSRAAVPEGVDVRVGGFGGIDGLRRHLDDGRFDAVVDATHPFAARMPFHAQAACDALGLALVRVLRPAWHAQPDDRWAVVDDVSAAAAEVARSGARRVFLTVGRQELAPFAACTGIELLVRSIDRPAPNVLADAEVLLSRGPFDVAAETELLRSRRIELLVSKNAGGSATYAKIEAARALGIPVVMVRRPPSPDVRTVATAAEALAWLAGQTAGGRR
ncbi:MAG: Precorrin-6A reductase [Ilumatobacteraceae bacterium]|nr:Precorrin-6A reductase [Ilumatobacteraceae bacterium]